MFTSFSELNTKMLEFKSVLKTQGLNIFHLDQYDALIKDLKELQDECRDIRMGSIRKQDEIDRLNMIIGRFRDDWGCYKEDKEPTRCDKCNRLEVICRCKETTKQENK